MFWLCFDLLLYGSMSLWRFSERGYGGGGRTKWMSVSNATASTLKKKTIATHTHTAVCAASKINKRSAIGDFIVPESN